jgi:OOP family OmpA-OmpF porin
MGSVSLAKFSIEKRAKFYHASVGFLSQNALVLCLNLARTPGKKGRRKMSTRALLAAASLAAVFGCATQEAPAPAPAPAPTPAPAPAQPAPVAKPAPEAPKKPAVVNIASTELFEFNKATLTPSARKLLDDEVLAKLKELGAIRYVNVNGHADRLGGSQYNQKLSEKRADAVRAYLVSKGVEAGRVETFGFGKTMPVKSCPDQKNRKDMIECLAPNRRVVVEIQGSPR